MYGVWCRGPDVRPLYPYGVCRAPEGRLSRILPKHLYVWFVSGRIHLKQCEWPFRESSGGSKRKRQNTSAVFGGLAAKAYIRKPWSWCDVEAQTLHRHQHQRLFPVCFAQMEPHLKKCLWEFLPPYQDLIRGIHLAWWWAA